jgi:hypothetical protein
MPPIYPRKNTPNHFGVFFIPGSSYAGIARNAYGFQGNGSVLVEQRRDIGQKGGGMLLRTAYASMFAVLEAATEETLQDIDPAKADQIPLRGEGIEGEG